MWDTFNNTDAMICGIIALIEIIFLFIYMPVTVIRLRHKIVTMGRLIPAIPMVVVGGGMPMGSAMQTFSGANQQPYPINAYQSMPLNVIQNQPPYNTSPNAPGFQQTQDLPPPYPVKE